MRRWLSFTVLLLVVLVFNSARASHIVGGEVTYKYLGSDKYQINLVIYEDCKNGEPQAIADDTPAYMSVYNLQTGALMYLDTTLEPVPDLSGRVPVNFTNSCVTNVPDVCLLRKTFSAVFTLPPNSKGYLADYQRCCRNAQVSNIFSPGDKGATYYCVIPASSLAVGNSSATFTNYPPQIICLNNPLYYDNSATDPDGDSLSYGFVSACEGADPGDVKPYPHPPDFSTFPYFDTVQYITPPFTAQRPMTGSPTIQIDPVTGIVTGTPNRLGRFLVTVCCYEWRHGVLINRVIREFQFVVTDCSKVVVACMPQFSTDVNTYIVECSTFTVNFVNCSSGGTTYHWDFGVPGTNSDTSDVSSPTYTYNDTGTYTVKLIVNPNTTCEDSISRFVKIYPYFKANYADTGTYCPGMPISFLDQSSATIKPITSWYWDFGDGSTSTLQNAQHSYSYGGVYNVMLVSENVKDCIDTALHQVVIENFTPFAGHDTIIVKGESIQFNATGGVQYTWTPSTNLNATDIYDPVGFYPDTGSFTYYVHVVSSFGCQGEDTVKVLVVNQAQFFMPTAFSPNGDGTNDYFRPVAVGYKSLKYFRIYDRWGEEVFLSKDLETGWDGTYHGKAMEIGTYYWQISFVDRFGKEAYLKGDVTLVR